MEEEVKPPDLQELIELLKKAEIEYRKTYPNERIIPMSPKGRLTPAMLREKK